MSVMAGERDTADSAEATATFDVAAACVMPRDLAADAITADGHAMTLWAEDDENLRFVWDGEPGAPFDALWSLRDKSPAVFVSPDGNHVAYMAMRDNQQFVGRDGGEDRPFDGLTRSVPPVFSHDGRHLAYGAGSGEEFWLILDGRQVSELPIAPIQAVFSRDGSRLAYVELRPSPKHHYDVRVVVDRVPGEWFAGMRNEGGVLQFSPDGSRFAYRENDTEGHVRWVVDGVPQQWTEVVLSLGQAFKRVAVVEAAVPAGFSPDSRRFAYFADVPGKGVSVIEDDVPGPRVKAVYNPVFSPDSRHLCYLAEQLDGRLALMTDGVPGPARVAKDGGGPWFSPDGRRVAMIVRRDEGGLFHRRKINTLVVDGETVAETEGDDVTVAPSFSPDGAHVAWWVQRGKTGRLMVDDREAPVDASVESDVLYTPSGRLAFAARTPAGAWTIVVDGRPGPLAEDVASPQDVLCRFGRELAPAPALPFAVSPDGDHVAWMGMIDGRYRPILDDRVGPAFDVPLGWSFDEAGVATWWAQRADVVYRVTAAP